MSDGTMGDRLTLRTVPAIVGPTGAGKTALAVALAERVGAAVVGADSRQLYRLFDVGTAKPSAEERTRVPHHGLDVAEPTERWSAARWADAAAGWVAEADAADRAPLLVGGTGFYLRALAEPLFAEPPLDPARRAVLARELDPLPTEQLRAAEVLELTGRPLSEWQREAARVPQVALRYLVVDPGPPLAAALERRVDLMLEHGWLAEVERLAGLVPDDAPAWQATGYDVWRAHLAGDLALARARERVIVDTRQYAKRQRTWFRHQLAPAAVEHLDPRRPDALDRALAWWGAVPNDVPGPGPAPATTTR